LPPGGADAGNGGVVLLPVSAAVPGVDLVDHHRSTRGGDVFGRRGLLQPALLLPHHDLPQLGRQPDSLQPDVDQVPRRLRASVRRASRSASAGDAHLRHRRLAADRPQRHVDVRLDAADVVVERVGRLVAPPPLDHVDQLQEIVATGAAGVVLGGFGREEATAATQQGRELRLTRPRRRTTTLKG
jgi:hypothetical protein